MTTASNVTFLFFTTGIPAFSKNDETNRSSERFLLFLNAPASVWLVFIRLPPSSVFPSTGVSLVPFRAIAGSIADLYFPMSVSQQPCFQKPF
jgi:hypothetical protein